MAVQLMLATAPFSGVTGHMDMHGPCIAQHGQARPAAHLLRHSCILLGALLEVLQDHLASQTVADEHPWDSPGQAGVHKR